MKDFHISDNRLLLYTGTDETVRVPDGVTEIGANAFAQNEYLKEIYLPDSVTAICGGAFANCAALRKVRFPAALETLAGHAFSRCESLREACLPDTLRHLGNGVFEGCEKLRRAVCGGAPTFEGNAFRGIFSGALGAGMYDAQGFLIFGGILFDYRGTAEEIAVPEGVRAVAAFAFACNWGTKTQLRSVYLPDSVREIGEQAFDSNETLARLRLPAGVKIGTNAFRRCSGLADETGAFCFEGTLYLYENITPEPTLPPDLTAVAAEVFRHSRVRRIVLPEGVRAVGRDAFRDCKDLEAVYLPDSLRELGDFAFADCKALKTLRIAPETALGENVFKGCSSLPAEDGFCIINNELFAYFGSDETVTVPPNVTAVNIGAFEGCMMREVRLPAGLRRLDRAFENCFHLRRIVIPEGVEAIASGTFLGCRTLESIRLPQSLKRIGKDAFRQCRALRFCEIPAGVTEIGESAFSDCRALVTAELPDGLQELMPNTFADCGFLRQVRFPAGLRTIRQGAFYGCRGLADAVLPDGLVSILAGAFEGCCSLWELRLPDSLACIEKNAFEDCDCLQTVHAGHVTAVIDPNAFPAKYGSGRPEPFVTVGDLLLRYQGADSTVRVPEGVYAIQSFAFSGTQMTELILPESVKVLCSHALSGAKALQRVVLPDGLYSIGRKAFTDCVSLTSVRLPAGLTELADDAFSGCTRLREISAAPENRHFSAKDGVLYDAAGKTLLYCPMAKPGAAFTVPDGVITVAPGAFSGNVEIKELTLPSCVQNLGEHAFPGRNLTRVTVAAGACRGKIGHDVFHIGDGGDLPPETQLPLFLIKNARAKLALAKLYLLRGKYDEDGYGCKAYLDTHRDAVLRHASPMLLPVAEQYYGIRKNGLPLPGASVDYGSLSEKAAVLLLEEAVLQRDACAIREIAAGCGHFAFLPRALGLACKYADAGTVRALIAVGADFRYEQGGALSRSYGAYKQNGYLVHPANYDLLLADTGAAADPSVHFGKLPETDAQPNTDAERLEILAALTERPGACGVNLPRLLFYAVLWDHAPVAAWLISHGVTLRPQADTPPVYKTEVRDPAEILTRADRHWQRTEFLNAFYTLPPEGLRRMITAFADLLAAEDRQMLLTDAAFFRTHYSEVLFPSSLLPEKKISVNEKLTDARIFGLLAQRAQLRGVNRTLLMRTAVEQNNTALLEEMENLGWMRPADADPLTELAVQLKHTDATAWLLNYKNNAAAHADRQKQLRSELEKDPFSASRMRKMWQLVSGEDGALTLYAYNGSAAEVTVPAAVGKKPVRAVGFQCFSAYNVSTARKEAMQAIKEVYIEEGVAEIGAYAFQYCTGLRRVYIPASVKSIGTGAFRCCDQLSEVCFAGPVPDMPPDVFLGCAALERMGAVVIDGVLLRCDFTSPMLPRLPEGITEIGPEVLFRNTSRFCALPQLILPASLRVIRDRAFCLRGRERSVAIGDVVMPAGLRSIGSEAFCGAGLERFLLGSGVETVGEGAFSYNLFSEVRIAASVKSVGSRAFYGCKNLKTVCFYGADTLVGENLLGEYAGDAFDQFSPAGVTVYAPPDSPAAKECARYAGVKVEALH